MGYVSLGAERLASRLPAGTVSMATPGSHIDTGTATVSVSEATLKVPSAEVMEAQALLKSLGFYNGLLTGLRDEVFTQALAMARARFRPDITGVFTKLDLDMLRVASEAGIAPGVPPGAATAATTNMQVAAPSGLPPWALPVGAVVGGLVLWKLFVK